VRHLLQYNLLFKVVIVMKRVIFFFIVILIIFFTTIPIIEGVYRTVFQSDTFFTFHNPLLFLTRYFLAIAVLFLILYLNIPLTQQGKKLLPAIVLVSFLGFLFTSFNFVATDDEKIVEQRLWGRDVKTWNEVKYIEIQSSIKEDLEPRVRSLVAAFKYQIYFKEGSSVNVWQDIDSNYRLHKFVTTKDIEIVIKNTHPRLWEKPGSYMPKDGVEKAKKIFGME
jgi:hypothetical protein